MIRQIVDRFEGHAFTNHPADKGGPTKHGVTQKLMAQALGRPVSVDEVRWLDLELAIEILYATFCLAPNLWRIEDPLVRLCAVDFAINSGPARGVRSLQYAVFPRPPYDGIFGPKTTAAVNAADPGQVRRDMLAYRVRFVGKVIAAKPSQAVFAGGWADRIATLMELEPGEQLRRAA